MHARTVVTPLLAWLSLATLAASSLGIGCGDDTAPGTGGAGSGGDAAQGGGGAAQGGGGAAQGGGGGGGGGAEPLCENSVPPSYAQCTGTTFEPDGTCAGGSCATTELAGTVYSAWRERALSLSGLSEADFDARVLMSTIETTGNFIRLEYVVSIDWLKARQADSVDVSGFSSPPTDAEVQHGLDLLHVDEQWATLGGSDAVATEAEFQRGFDTCACDIPIDWCSIDFKNPDGTLTASGVKELEGVNECLAARVDAVTGELLSCDPTPCSIN